MFSSAVIKRVAGLRDRPESLTAHILDRVVEIAGGDLQDWEINQQLGDFKEEILEKIDFNRPGYADWVDVQTDQFLEKLRLQDGKEKK